MKGADYCISGGNLTRHTGCHWHRSQRGLSATPKLTNMGIYMYLYAGPTEVYLLRRKDSFANRRGTAISLVAEGPLQKVWGDFLAYGRMASCVSS